MQFRHLTKTVLTLAAAGCCCAACAHPLFVHTADSLGAESIQRYVAPEDLLFALPQSENQPKLWRNMNAEECRENAEFRSRFVSPDNCRYRGHGGPAPRQEHVLSPEERDLMRQQIREMHVQIYHYRHGAPSVVVTPLSPDSDQETARSAQ